MESLSLAVISCVVVTAVIQSLFGVGVLLFGTPLLLLLGYPFIETLLILLPISITINLLQITKHHAHIDREFYRTVLVYTVPFVVLFLLLVSRSSINVSLIVGLFLILVAAKDVSPHVTRLVARLMRYEKGYFITMGIVHGLSNLGGSLLTAAVHEKRYNKDVSRVTTAASYATLAVFQLATLASFSSLKQLDVSYSNAVYLAVGPLVFILTERPLYNKLGSERYRAIFALFLAVSGLLLISKSVCPLLIAKLVILAE